jgi:hypothetical protein
LRVEDGENGLGLARIDLELDPPLTGALGLFRDRRMAGRRKGGGKGERRDSTHRHHSTQCRH